MSEQQVQKEARVGRPRVSAEEELGAVQSFRCHTSEHAYIALQAKAAGMRPGPYCRRRVLGLPISPAQIHLDPSKLDRLIDQLNERPAEGRPVVPDGLLHELSQLSVAFVNVGNLANQLARDHHTGRAFSHDWQQVRDDLKATQQQIAAVMGKIAGLIDD